MKKANYFLPLLITILFGCSLNATSFTINNGGKVTGTFEVLDLPRAEEEWTMSYPSSTITLTYLGAVECVPGGIIYVDADALGDGDGTNWANAYTKLQDALDIACDCEEPVQIWVAEGTYYADEGVGQINNSLNSTFQLCNDVELYGGFAGNEINLGDRDWFSNETILSGDVNGDANMNGNAYHVVTSSGSNTSAILDGFTITSGNSNNNGGGIYNSGGSPTIQNCFVHDNRTEIYGGGMYNSSSSNPKIVNSVFSGNIAVGYSYPQGGGIYNIYSSSPQFINCVISGNAAGYGGGVFNTVSCNPTFTNCSFSGNASTSGGGAIYNNVGSHSDVINCILWNNSDNGSTTTTAASITNSGSTATVSYSLVANSGGSGGGWQSSIGTDGGNNIAADALFILNANPANAPTTEGNLRLQSGSPALDVANNTGNGESYDADGNDRVFNSIIDMGAYEYQVETACPAVIFVRANASGNNDGTSWTNAYTFLQDALDFACTCEGTNQIWVAEGTYYPDQGNAQINNQRTSTFALCSGVAIYGGFEGNEVNLEDRDWLANPTILHGDIDGDATLANNAYNVVTGSGTDSTALLSGFTIMGGNANGGGAYPASNNNGAGMHTNAGSPTVEYCIFSGNTAGEDGGGMMNHTNSNPSISNCTFISNTAQYGGGMSNYNNSLTLVVNTSFMGNTSIGDSYGGAVSNYSGGSPTFINCHFSGNKANFGGAIFNYTNCHSTIINSTLSGNWAVNDGGGGALRNSVASSLTIINSIIWNNRNGTTTTNTSASILNSSGGTSTVAYSLIANSGGSGNWNPAIGTDDGNNIDANPQFILPVDPATAPTTAGNLQLTEFSPLNLGSNAAYDVVGDPENDIDLANNPRVYDFNSSGIIDMGAYEFQGQSACPDGSIVYVKASATGANNGTSWVDAYTKLQDALFTACSCSGVTQVWVAEGTYYPDEGNGQSNNSRNSSFQLCNGKAVYGGFDGTETTLSERDWNANETILSGNIDNMPSTTGNAYHVVLASNTNNTALLDGFTITEGNANGAVDPLNLGGGVYKANGAAKFQHIYFTLNLASVGASYYSLSGNSTLTDCTFENNYGSVVVGGVINQASPAVITRCHFINNTGGIETAAIGNTAATVTIIDCSFIGNVAGVGNGNAGAVHSWNSTVNFYNCLFSGNKATRNGGAIFNTYYTVANIINCTFSGNKTTLEGGAIFNEQNAIANVKNSVIWNNQAGPSTTSTSASIANSTATTNVSYSLVANSGGSGAGWQSAIGTDGGNNIAGNPLFILDVNPATAPTLAGDLHVQPSSPVINAGNNAVNTQPFDLDGLTRISGALIDMGAFELDIPCMPVTWYADADADGFGDPTDSIVDCLQSSGYVGNNTDNCPGISNPLQEDFDTDLVGDTCDADDDNDGVADTEDGCPFDPDKSAPGNCGCGIPDIDASIAPAMPSIACQGESEVLTASGGTTYLWSTGDTTSSIEVSPSVSTVYAVTVSTSLNCSDTASVLVEVQNHAPYFEYTGNIGFEESVVYPTTGSPYTQYHFEVTYVDADGDMPINAFPKLQLDFEGNGLLTDPNDRSHLMQPADPSDLDVVDGKVYYYNAIGLEPGINWEATFVAITEDGCSGQSAVYDVPDILVSPDVYLFANDISFSENNPDPGESFTVYAVIHNGSDFTANDFTVRLLNHFTGETYTDILISSLPPHETMTVSWVIDAPDEPSWNPMRVTVDDQNTIAETNELNNTAVRPFICGDFNLPGSIIAYTGIGPNPAYEGQGMGLYGTAYYTGTAVPLQDSSCAGATVTMMIVETNQTFVMETSAHGFFSTGFIAPPPGTYTIEGEVTDYTLTGYFTTTFTVIEPPVIPCAVDYVCAFVGDFTIIEGESVAPQFVVSNLGCDPATAASSASALREGGSPANEEFVIPALGGGGSQVYNLSPITYTNPGTYTLYGAVDQGDDIVETLENNNACIAHVSVVPNLPDIVAHTHAPIDPLYLCFSQGLTFTFSNIGVAPTGQFNTRLEIVNANNEVVKLVTITTPNLNFEQSASIGFSNYMFPDTGYYTAKVTCDFPHPPGAVTESNEGNNTFEISFRIIDCGVNLVWHSICEINQGVSPVNPTNPGNITVSRRLTNAGTEAATENIPITFEVNGNVYAEVIPALAVGESAQVSMSIPAPTHGNNEIIFTIDPEQTLAGEDPGGNVASEPLCWDFSVYHAESCNPGSVWNLPYLLLDQPVTFDIGLVNYGLYKASPVHVSFEVSGPGISGWLDLGEVTMTGPINTTCGCPITVSLPYTYSFDQVGLFSVRMIVDPEDVFEECNENNNEIILQVMVINVPDLKVLSQFIDPSELNPDVNEEVSFNITYKNIGMNNVQDNFELLLLVDEVRIDSVQVPGLITGDFNTVSMPNTWSSMLPGLHVVRAIIDSDDDVLEATNSNNEATRAIIVGSSVNLHFLAFAHTLPSGGSLDITGTIHNAGNLSCTADLQLYYLDDFGNEQFITTIPVTLGGNSNMSFSYNWLIADQNTTLLGRIVNVSELEYNEDDNEGSTVLQVLDLDIVATDEHCIGSNDGTATVTVTGGTAPYDYQWSTGHTGDQIEIGAGQYIISVSDANGNLTTATVVISDSGIPMQVFYRDLDGDGFGDLNQDTTSCEQPLDYVTNHEDCNDNNANVNPSAIETCNGMDDDCDGLIDGADPDVTGQATWYADTDNDGYGNAVLFTVSCIQPSGYVANANDCDDTNAAIHPNASETCNAKDDDCDGSIDEGMTDSDSDGVCNSIDNCPFTYNPDQADNEHDGIGDVCDPNDDNDPKPDSNDCAPFDPTTYPGAPEICGDLIDNNCNNKIDEQLKIVVLLEKDVLCNGDATGIISVTGECGLPPYTYQWTNGGNTATITNLIQGQYKVTVTDAQGLVKTKSFNITQPNALSLTINKTDVSCFGGNDGTAKAIPGGGNSPYTYLWSNGATTKNISGLYQGMYAVTVTDENGCTITGTVSIDEPTPVQITNIVVSLDPGHPGKYRITVTADGGTPYSSGYKYRRCNSSGSGCNGWQDSNILTNLNPGSYLVRVKDANGCIAEQLVDIEASQSYALVIEDNVIAVDNVRVEQVQPAPVHFEDEAVSFDFRSVYPNPGSESVMVNWNCSGLESVDIVVLDIYGKEIIRIKKEGVVGNNSLRLDMSAVPLGLYVITINSGNLKHSKIWVKAE